MGVRKTVVEVRNLLVAKGHQLGTKGATTAEIVDLVSKENPAAINRASADLIKIALTRIFNSAKDRRPRGLEPRQLTLFKEFSVPTFIGVPSGRKGGGTLNKNLNDATLAEVESYLDQLPVPRKKSKKDEAIRGMMETLRPYAKSDRSTVRQCWTAAQEAEKKEKRSD